MIHTLLVFGGLALGLALLMKGADIFVDAAVGIAHRVRLSPVIIGMTIVSMGTSIPELVISTTAAIGGANDLAVANAVGANIFNLLGIIGLAAVVRALPVRFGEISRSFWLSVIAAAFLLVMSFTPQATVPRFASAMMLVAYAAYIIYTVRRAPRTPTPEAKLAEAEAAATERKLSVYILFALAACVLIFVGGQLTVWSAENMGPIIGLSERVVGLTIVSISTSLPELIIVLLASKRGENEMAVGTIIGSNIFNIMVVLGATGAIVPLAVGAGTRVDLSLLVGGSLLFLLFVTSSKRLTRWEGAVMAAIYTAYLVFLIIGTA